LALPHYCRGVGQRDLEIRVGTAAEPKLKGGPVGGFVTGVGFLFRGLRMYARNPRMMLLGIVPALIAFVALAAAFVAMVYYVDNVVVWATPYANDWPSGFRDTARLVAMLGIAAVFVVLSVLAYVALTLLIGQPFYEAISKRVEDQLGGVPGEVNVSFWKSFPRTVFDSIRLALLAAFFGVGVFVLGFIPVVGQISTPVLGALLGGWVLVVELTSVPFERRGLRYRHRKRALRQNRSMALGFGAATFVSFLIPLGAIVVMPAAVAGATLLSRRILHPGA
jgi:CysZ protein